MPRPVEYYARLEAAADVLASSRARIEWINPATGKGGRRTVVRVEDLPRGPGALDDEVVVSVFVGADRRPRPLWHWGRRSERAYQALLGLAFRWHRPGVTRFPAPGRDRGGKPWLYSADPDRYETPVG